MNCARGLPPVGAVAFTGLGFAALFLAFPALDLAPARWLYRHMHFVLDGNLVSDFIHAHIGAIGLTVAIGLWLRRWFSGRKTQPDGWRRKVAYVLLALLLGPGLLVNVVLKDHWGRPRPSQIEPFGGHATFIRAWIPSNQCDTNCAFVCGDASVGFSLVIMAFLSSRPRRWLAAGIVAGSAIGLMRMAQGGHFLSDVVFSFYAVYFSAWWLYRLLFPDLQIETRRGAAG